MGSSHPSGSVESPLVTVQGHPDLQFLNFTFQVDAPPDSCLFLCMVRSKTLPTSPPPSLAPFWKTTSDEEREPKEERAWPDHGLIVLVTSNGCMVLALSFSPSRLINLSLFCTSTKASFAPLLLQLLQLLEHFSLIVFLVLSSACPS